MNFKNVLFIFTSLISIFVYSQVGIGTTTPDSSSLLDISSVDKGILIPRMTETQKNAISDPANGLLVYQTTASSGFYYYNGSNWISLTAADGDNLGNHLATQTFNMGSNNFTNANSIGLRGTSSTVFDFNRFDAGSTSNDQLRLSANGINVFGVLGDGRVNTRNNILMVNNATIDNVDVSDMVGIIGSDLGVFTGTTIADGVSIKEALQILENAVEASIVASAEEEQSVELENVTPKFSVTTGKNAFFNTNNKILRFDTIEFDNLKGYSKENNVYVIPVSGTYFIQFQCAVENIENTIDKQVYIGVAKNDIEVSRTSFILDTSATNAMNTVSIFKTFKKGDQVKPTVNLGNATYVINTVTTSFSGFMVN